MPILDDPKTLLQFIEPGQKLMGLDLGTKTIGLAVSDTMVNIATPLETIKRSKFTKDTQSLRAIEETHNIGALVIGLPLNMDGSEGPRVQASRAFARNLLQQKDQPIVFWDERLSTSAVTRTLIDADMSRAKRADLVDKMAAGYILQGVLDLLNN